MNVLKSPIIICCSSNVKFWTSRVCGISSPRFIRCIDNAKDKVQHEISNPVLDSQKEVGTFYRINNLFLKF